MLKKVILPLAGITLATGLYLQKQKIHLKNDTLRTVLQLLYNQNPKYSTFLLKNMIRFEMIKRCESMRDYVFSQGFDFDAICLNGLMEIGFDTVEIGPLSLIPSCSEEKRMHFGNKTALGNINVFYEQVQLTPQKQLNSKIGISITPNIQIIKYAPYLIEQNMLNCLKQFQYLNENSQSLKIHRYILKLNDPELKQKNTPQSLTLIKSLITNSQTAIEQTFQTNKKEFPTSTTLLKPQVLIQIPNKTDNPKLYELITSLPQVKHLIIDDVQYQVVRVVQKVNKKVVESINLALGKRRLTFSNLLDKVINSSL